MAYRIIGILTAGLFAASCAVLFAAWCCVLPADAQQTQVSQTLPATGVEVVKAVPNVALTHAFENFEGWTGGDAAYSLPLSRTRGLWLFGDTFIGKIENGVRTKAEMVHNTAAWLDRCSGDNYAVRYFWRSKSQQPAALLEPKRNPRGYYWPSAMSMNAGQLSVFCKLVVDKPGDNSGFGFDWIGQELALVTNPSEPPSKWQYSILPLPGGEAGIFPGSAAFEHDEWVYVYGTTKLENRHLCVLMRIAATDLARGETSNFQYWTYRQNEAGERVSEKVWSNLPLNIVTLFDQSAPEMSVGKIPGLTGFWAIYSENGLSANIMLRHADKPEGPWSEPITVYKAPEPGRHAGLLCYGAKHHPELSTQDRELVITYCLNPGPIKAHRVQPMTYFPKAITVTLKPVP